VNAADRRAWVAFENVCSNFWGNKKSEHYVNVVEELLSSPWFGVQHVVDTPFLAIPFGFFPLEIWYPSLANTASVCIRISWKKKK
jgi:hypothetical protein